jgi:hypothetical protein
MVLFNNVLGTFRKRCREECTPSREDADAVTDLGIEVGQVLC